MTPLQIAEPLPSIVPTAAKRGDAKARARASAEEYEAVFLSAMMKQMFAGLETSGPFHGGQAEETWRGMLIDQYGKEMVRRGGIGVADTVYREMLRIQEGAAS
ncbi:rod-binding protein [Prosthecomicrobium sp. N25]|uniref:rod-binding protein n=1 Tax=Prosthecomicrobium sp. N25 TaxID=3129254 RepID=UPI0030784CCC